MLEGFLGLIMAIGGAAGIICALVALTNLLPEGRPLYGIRNEPARESPGTFEELPPLPKPTVAMSVDADTVNDMPSDVWFNAGHTTGEPAEDA
jgi:hypothetical protein